MVASRKGGVGKTTVTANLGLSLARLGHRTLMIDCDFAMRCLDIVSGLADDVAYDLSDCLFRGISPARAAVTDPRCERLFFIAAPYRCEEAVTAEGFGDFLKAAERELELDCILIDTHGGEGTEIVPASRFAGLALVVATHQEASIRAAEETAFRLTELGVRECRLIVNCYDKKAAKKKRLPGVIELIDRTGVRLIGVIPYDEASTEMQITGKLAAEDKKSPAGLAYNNIARRISGASVPLSVN